LRKPRNLNAIGRSSEDPLDHPPEDVALLEEIGVEIKTPKFRRSKKKTP